MKTLYLLLLIPIISFSQYNINIDMGIIDYPEPGSASTYSLGINKMITDDWGVTVDYKFTEIPQDQFYSLQLVGIYKLDDIWSNVQIGAGISHVFKYNDNPALFLVRYNVRLTEYLYLSPQIKHIFGKLKYQNTYLTLGFQIKII